MRFSNISLCCSGSLSYISLNSGNSRANRRFIELMTMSESDSPRTHNTNALNIFSSSSSSTCLSDIVVES